MGDGDDLEYFRMRAATSREQAARSADPRVRACHLEFASHYDLFVELELVELSLASAKAA